MADGSPWYSQIHIKEAISHESIANLEATRSLWQRRVDETKVDTHRPFSPPPPPAHQRKPIASPNQFLKNGHGSDSDSPAATYNNEYHPVENVYPLQYNGSGTVINVDNGDYDHSPAGQNGVDKGLNIIEREIEEYRQREAELKKRSASTPPTQRYNDESPLTDYHDVSERDQELMLCYIKQRPEVLGNLGIPIPGHVRHRVQSLGPAVPRVELCEMMDGGQPRGYFETPSLQPTPPNRNYVNRYNTGETSNGFSSAHSSRQSTLERPQHNGRNYVQGRYIKHTQPSQRKMPRKPSLDAGKPRHQWRSSENSSPTPLNLEPRKSPTKLAYGDGIGEQNGAFYSPGENLIAREIREARDREEELSRSRSELGLPTLYDIMEGWRLGGSVSPYARYPGSLRNAHSYDHLQWAIDKDGDRSGLYKSGSLDRLHHQQNMAYETKRPPDETNDPGFDSGEEQRFSTDRRDGRNEEWQNEAPSTSKKPMLNGSSEQRTPYEKFLSAHHPNKPVTKFSAGETNGRDSYVPVESRIEKEVEELQRREDELRKQRGSFDLDYTPVGLQMVESEQSEDSSANGDLRARRYERRSGFLPADDYDFQREDYDFQKAQTANEIILTPNGRED